MAAPILDPNAPAFTRRYMNLADPRLGAKALFASDEFFAPKERMLDPEPAVFIPGKYDDHGKWMDGWETRRKRTTGYDFCVVRLARPGVVYGVDLDTSHFTGNFPPAASIDACVSDADTPPDDAVWETLVPATTLAGNQHHYVDVSNPRAYTHLRVNLYPDGGLARLRVYGQPQRDWSRAARGELVDLAAIENGAYLVAANNEHFGPASRMLMPGRGVNMGDGWGDAPAPRARQRLGDHRARAAGRDSQGSKSIPRTSRAISGTAARCRRRASRAAPMRRSSRRRCSGRRCSASSRCGWTACTRSRRSSRRSARSRTYA